MTTETPLRVESWRALQSAHIRRMERWTTPRRQRRARHEKHPVYDFLFDYYRYSTAKLLEWHPPLGVSLEVPIDHDGAAAAWFPPPHYRRRGSALVREPRALTPKARTRLAWTLDLLRRTQSRPPWLECYGLHEWAMVYGGAQERHVGHLDLRLERDDIDRFVESQAVVCTHFDAYRFFSDEAKPLNRARPSREARTELEQPGCVHANMDLYKWAYKSMPWIGSDLLADCFELAAELRELDMRASPYDLTPLGFTPVPVETGAGRAQYVEHQRALSRRAAPLRARLIDAVASVLEVKVVATAEAPP